MAKAGFNKEQIDDVCAARGKISAKDQRIVSADILTPNQTRSKSHKTKKHNRNIESWYFKFGLGPVEIYYPSELQKSVDTLEKTPGVSRSSAAVDLGLYFPLRDDKSVIGFNMNGYSDEFKDAYGNKMTVSFYKYAFSYLYYFKEIRDGFYVRADMGVAKGNLDWSLLGNSGNTTSETGLGAAFGGGYSFGFDGWGLSAEALYSDLHIENEDYRSAQILFSLMF